LKVSLKTDGLNADLYSSLWPRIVDYVTHLVNLSLYTGVVPPPLKVAVLTPILKSSSMDSNNMSSYRPVSNLPFLGKLLESAVAQQLNEHISNHLSPFQSAFRSGHSVESALCHVSSSIFQLLDNGFNVFVILLDLSAAFDTIDHNLLLNILYDRFKIRGTVLKWIESYLQDRYFKVSIRNTISNRFPLKVGVPQGSILGPILFNCVMTKLADMLTQADVTFHMYADDTQLWFPFQQENECEIRSEISSVFSAIESFMFKHHLKLNANKTVFLPVSRSNLQFSPLVLKPNLSIPPSTSARNLGIMFDSSLSFTTHIAELRRSCFYHLKNIKQLAPFVPSSQHVSLVLSIVISRLDFCSSLFCALNSTQLNRLQNIQNACARLITKTRLRDSITPKLKSLHWLPVKYRKVFKLAQWGHKIIYNNSNNTPEYFTNVLRQKQPSRFTRSSLTPSLTHLNYNLKSVGGRGVFTNISSTWNNLPPDLRRIESFVRFKKQLKTHLFTEAYG
jgi:hypothetical protein